MLIYLLVGVCVCVCAGRRGYLLTQVAGGIWADKFGGKLVLGMGVVWWSLATALTPLAATCGLPTLLAARAIMGIGEGKESRTRRRQAKIINHIHTYVQTYIIDYRHT